MPTWYGMQGAGRWSKAALCWERDEWVAQGIGGRCGDRVVGHSQRKGRCSSHRGVGCDYAMAGTCPRWHVSHACHWLALSAPNLRACALTTHQNPTRPRPCAPFLLPAASHTSSCPCARPSPFHPLAHHFDRAPVRPPMPPVPCALPFLPAFHCLPQRPLALAQPYHAPLPRSLGHQMAHPRLPAPSRAARPLRTCPHSPDHQASPQNNTMSVVPFFHPCPCSRVPCPKPTKWLTHMPAAPTFPHSPQATK